MKVLRSIFSNSCPRCHKGKVFETSNGYNLAKFSKMHETCSHCGLKYEKEVGFFYGAMYVSYGLTSGFFIISYVLDQLYFQAETWKFIVFVLSTYVLLMPLTYRFARLIWLNIFFPFKEK
ncbi:MAG: DUF983 domain-containing protein [Bacteroidetes bacterium]|nr:DUF983 domain-containing protein [Bacteroidota bacterium]